MRVKPSWLRPMPKKSLSNSQNLCLIPPSNLTTPLRSRAECNRLELADRPYADLGELASAPTAPRSFWRCPGLGQFLSKSLLDFGHGFLNQPTVILELELSHDHVAGQLPGQLHHLLAQVVDRSFFG